MEFHHFQHKINLIQNSTEAKTKILLPEVLSFMNFIHHVHMASKQSKYIS